MEQEPEQAGEEAGPGPRPLREAGVEGSAEKQSESPRYPAPSGTSGSGGREVAVERSDLAPLLGKAPAAPRGRWSPAEEDTAVPLLCGPNELPAHGHRGASPPAELVPPDAAGPVLAQEARGRESPASWGGSPSLESASSSILSLSVEEGETSGSEVGAAAAACCIQAAGTDGEEECPICTEPYDGERHKQALLNCNHVLCSACLRAIMDAAGSAEFGRVRCPICRQKTPMLEWEICKLQEELLLLHAQPAPASAQAAPRPAALPPRRPGVAGALEHHFQVRFHTSRMFGCLPCVRYPLCLIRGLGRLEHRCRCCYLVLLAVLLAAEMLSLLLIFLPIVLLVLLFLILDK
ncbi:ring finger protein-like [Struthio camelus]|uniref:ring finger protein-like n=1 Tax=Struthio camelus TaxID=8801 RepID=UPI0036040B87